eukprot:1318334-Rhodomonas_salina.3
MKLDPQSLLPGDQVSSVLASLRSARVWVLQVDLRPAPAEWVWALSPLLDGAGPLLAAGLLFMEALPLFMEVVLLFMEALRLFMEAQCACLWSRCACLWKQYSRLWTQRCHIWAQRAVIGGPVLTRKGGRRLRAGGADGEDEEGRQRGVGSREPALGQGKAQLLSR